MTDTRSGITRPLDPRDASAPPSWARGKPEEPTALPRWALGKLPSNEGELPIPAGAEAGGWIRRLYPVFEAHRRLIVLAIFSTLLAVLGQTLSPLVQKEIIDGPILDHTKNLVPLMGLMCLLFAVRFVFGQIRRYTGGRIAWDVDFDMRNAVFNHIQGLDFARHDELQTGQLVSRTNSDLNLVRQLFNQTPNILSNALQFLLALGIMFYLSPLLAATTVPFVPPSPMQPPTQSSESRFSSPNRWPSARWPWSVPRTAPTGPPTATPILAPTAPPVAALVPLCDSAREPEPKEDVT